MIELWIGGIATTIAACIWAAWGPKVLLGTILGAIAFVLVSGSLFLQAQARDQKHETVTQCFNLPDLYKHYENPADCRKAGGVPYADRYPDLYREYK